MRHLLGCPTRHKKSRNLQACQHTHPPPHFCHPPSRRWSGHRNHQRTFGPFENRNDHGVSPRRPGWERTRLQPAGYVVRIAGTGVQTRHLSVLRQKRPKSGRNRQSTGFRKNRNGRSGCPAFRQLSFLSTMTHIKKRRLITGVLISQRLDSVKLMT